MKSEVVNMQIQYSADDCGIGVDSTSSLLVVLTQKELLTKITASSLNLQADDYSIFLAVGESLRPQRETSTSKSFVFTSTGFVRHCTVALLPTTFSRHNSPGCFPSYLPVFVSHT